MTIPLTKRQPFTTPNSSTWFNMALCLSAVVGSLSSAFGLTLVSAAEDLESGRKSSHASSNGSRPISQTKSTLSGRKDPMMNNIYSFQARTLDGKDISLGEYEGDLLLIVNTASECGFTPQYAGLEHLHERFSSKGLRILGFPCNQFGGQEPGNNEQISTFCRRNYGVEFQMFEKVDVNGKNAHPLFMHLKSEAPGALGTQDIKWNFTKFLVNRQGKVVKRYAPTVKPEDIAPEIEKQLQPSIDR